MKCDPIKGLNRRTRYFNLTKLKHLTCKKVTENELSKLDSYRVYSFKKNFDYYVENPIAQGYHVEFSKKLPYIILPPIH